MSTTKLRFLSAGEVRAALPMAEAVEVMKEAFALLSAGAGVCPQRAHIHVPGRPPGPGSGQSPGPGAEGDALFMPSALPEKGCMGMKVVTLFPGNTAKGLPLIQALMVLVDGACGAPLAVMDGAALTAIRTGAASGAATDLMARKDAERAAVFGAGVQARTQLEAVASVRRLRGAGVFDPRRDLARAFAAEMSQRLAFPVEAEPSPRAALEGADVVCTATTSSTPVFDDGDLGVGVHINAVGSYKPEVREIPGETVARARVVVDHLPSALEEAGDLLIPMAEKLIGQDHIHAELGELVSGAKAGRESPEEITFFKSVGVALQDLAAAHRLFENARKNGLGTEVSI